MENVSGMYCIQFRRNQQTQQPDLVGITSFGRENLQSPIVEELESYFRAHYPSCPQPVVIRGRGKSDPATMQLDPPCDYDHRDEDIYLIRVPSEVLLAQDNAGQVLYPIPNPCELVISLYAIQLHVQNQPHVDFEIV
jgi:hypothetical protein